MKKDYSQNPWIFVALTLLLTWGFWGAAIILDKPIDQFPTGLLMALGGVGPMAAVIILLNTVNDRNYRREFASRLFDPRRIPLNWGLIILLFSPVLAIIAFLISQPLFGIPLMINRSREFLNRGPGGFLWLLIFTLFFGPVPEEIGWRGYAQDRLQNRYSALITSLIIGLIWSTWHFPLCFIEGTFQYSLGVGSPIFWRYFLDKLPEAVIMTWIYNHTRRSTLSAVLFHFITNLNPVEGIFATHKEGAAFLPAEETLWILFVLRITAAVLIVVIWGPRTLSGRMKKLS